MIKLEIIERFPDHFPEGIPTASVNWNDYKTGEGDTIVWTPDLASCLAVTLYSACQCKGNLAHLTQGQRDGVPPCMFPENVIATLASAITKDHQKLEATLAGESQGEIGISAIVRRRLGELRIPVVGEDIGIVPIGREVHLHCATGKVTVYRYTIN